MPAMDQATIIASLESRASALGVPLYKICEAAGIAASTYYRWKDGTPASLAKTAAIQAVLTRMENEHGAG